MLDVARDIHSLTEFKTKTPVFLAEIREPGRALLLTVNGRAELAVMSASTFQQVLMHECHAESPALGAYPSEVREPLSGSLEQVLLDCLIALAHDAAGSSKLEAVRQALESRFKNPRSSDAADARVRVALGLLEAARALGTSSSTDSGDESGLGVPISNERWERIFGRKRT